MATFEGGSFEFMLFDGDMVLVGGDQFLEQVIIDEEDDFQGGYYSDELQEQNSSVMPIPDDLEIPEEEKGYEEHYTAVSNEADKYEDIDIKNDSDDNDYNYDYDNNDTEEVNHPAYSTNYEKNEVGEYETPDEPGTAYFGGNIDSLFEDPNDYNSLFEGGDEYQDTIKNEMEDYKNSNIF